MTPGTTTTKISKDGRCGKELGSCKIGYCCSCSCSCSCSQYEWYSKMMNTMVKLQVLLPRRSIISNISKIGNFQKAINKFSK